MSGTEPRGTRPLYAAQTPGAPSKEPRSAPSRSGWLRMAVVLVCVTLVIAGLVAVFRSPDQVAMVDEEETGFVLENLRARIYQDGKLQGDVVARRGLLNVDTQQAGLEGVDVTFFDQLGKVSGKVHSERGKMFLQDHPDEEVAKNDLELRGSVRFEGPGGMVITMPGLRYHDKDGRIVSNGGWFEKRIPTGKNATMVCRGSRFETTRELNEITDYGAEVRVHGPDESRAAR